MAKPKWFLGAAAIAVAALLGSWPAELAAQQTLDPAIKIGEADLGGVVNGPNGPEAGVWVIAETTELPTKMAKIVVTDDKGRYVMPDLPKANYSVECLSKDRDSLLAFYDFPAEHWKHLRTTNQFVDHNSGLCLNFPSTSNGQQLQINSCNGSSGEMFKLNEQ